jgi:hypothetical protein
VPVAKKGPQPARAKKLSGDDELRATRASLPGWIVRRRSNGSYTLICPCGERAFTSRKKAFSHNCMGDPNFPTYWEPSNNSGKKKTATTPAKSRAVTRPSYFSSAATNFWV